ncbi:MAG TPA: hypothetical protein VLF60_00540 [Candidatus Saccharimonadales bacterium]|nr:hypothetical protein [Candidatus Saccharimonadales bacterium]
MSSRRLRYYIEGGSLQGSSYLYRGCKDTSPPLKVRSHILPYELYFGDQSKSWTGSVAFIAPEPSDARTLARAYLITFEQFCSIVAEESYLTEPVKIRKTSESHYQIEPEISGMYDHLLYCGNLEGYPMLTFTAKVPQPAPIRPAVPYLEIIAEGLREAHGLEGTALLEYLHQHRGLKNTYTKVELADALGLPELLHASA